LKIAEAPSVYLSGPIRRDGAYQDSGYRGRGRNFHKYSRKHFWLFRNERILVKKKLIMLY